jgi:hypothetical protein
MRMFVQVPGQWPGLWTRIIIVLIVIVLAYRWVPAALAPIIFGTGLGSWLASAPTSMYGTVGGRSQLRT